LGNVAAIALTSESPRGSHRPRLKVAERSWRFGWPLSIWLGVSALTLYIDRLILGTVVSPTELGIYSANADLVVRGLTVVAAPVVLTIHPVVMREHNAGREAQSRAALQRWSGILAALLALSVAAVVVMGPGVVPVLLNEDSLGRGTLAVLALGAAMWQYALLAHKPYELRHETSTIMWFAIVALAVEVVVSSLTVHALGSLGVATGLLSSALFYLTCVGLGNHRKARALPTPAVMPRRVP
jgi:O-antigen/teichoic acid export membrane protein